MDNLRFDVGDFCCDKCHRDLAYCHVDDVCIYEPAESSDEKYFCSKDCRSNYLYTN